jgi:hypothetical protein
MTIPSLRNRFGISFLKNPAISLPSPQSAPTTTGVMTGGASMHTHITRALHVCAATANAMAAGPKHRFSIFLLRMTCIIILIRHSAGMAQQVKMAWTF